MGFYWLLNLTDSALFTKVGQSEGCKNVLWSAAYCWCLQTIKQLQRAIREKGSVQLRTTPPAQPHRHIYASNAVPSGSHLGHSRVYRMLKQGKRSSLPEISSPGSWLSELRLGVWTELTTQASAAAALATAEAREEVHLCFHFLPEPLLAYEAAVSTRGLFLWAISSNSPLWVI